MHIVTSWCEGVVRNGPFSLSHTRTRTHAHRTQSPTLVFYWGLFGLQGEKVLDARIDRLTAEYSIFEFSGTVEGVSTDAQPHPAATNCKVVPGSHPSLLCRLFSQRPPVAHVCVGECGCLYVCAVRLCVCVCVMSRMGLVSPNTLSHRTITLLSAPVPGLALPSCRYAE